MHGKFRDQNALSGDRCNLGNFKFCWTAAFWFKWHYKKKVSVPQNYLPEVCLASSAMLPRDGESQIWSESPAVAIGVAPSG